MSLARASIDAALAGQAVGKSHDENNFRAGQLPQ